MNAVNFPAVKLRKIVPLIGLGAAALAVGTLPAQASSHREAPFITELPKVDATDVYMFRSYEPGRENFVTLVTDYVPFQDAYGGPNYFALDPDALYEIHIDNDGDAQEDITFQFRFENTLKGAELNINGEMVPIPLINSGPIGPGREDTENLNRTESFSVDLIRGDRRRGEVQTITPAMDSDNADSGMFFPARGGPPVGGPGSFIFDKPVDYIGTKSIPDYETYAANHIYNVNIPGCDAGRMFVGQRDDPFVVNLGEVFDLVNIEDPLGPRDAEEDNIADKNVTSLILEVPIDCLTSEGEPVIGAWTTASLPRRRVLDRNPTFENPAEELGQFVQVSRLGIPLVNEVVIGLPDKNLFNSSEPMNDIENFGIYVTNPTLPALIETLFPSAPAPTLFPREDLVAVFVTGIEGVNQPANVKPGEMLRLNTAIPPTPLESQNNLGALQCFVDGELVLPPANPNCDPAGFPNGRRPGDDVVDIELRVAMGALIAAGVFGDPSQAPAGTAPFTDGAILSAADYGAAFPYLNTPFRGAPFPPEVDEAALGGTDEGTGDTNDGTGTGDTTDGGTTDTGDTMGTGNDMTGTDADTTGPGGIAGPGNVIAPGSISIGLGNGSDDNDSTAGDIFGPGIFIDRF